MYLHENSDINPDIPMTFSTTKGVCTYVHVDKS
jgi:hypothetical protein